VQTFVFWNLPNGFGFIARFALQGFRNARCIMDFNINLDSSPMHNEVMALLKPSVRDFQIVKSVGKFS
jgi:hypothetical protein